MRLLLGLTWGFSPTSRLRTVGALSSAPALLLVVLVLVLSRSLAAETVRIRVIDGRNGHPWAKKHIEVYDASDPHEKSLPHTFAEGKTNKEGIFVVNLDPSTVVGVAGAFRCLSKTQTIAPRWRVADIIVTGGVQENFCNFKITTAPAPGEIVVFVRPETLKEILDID
ncbi:MAG TPA: hypothetical protein VIX90_10620 [Edaphobacter sp.]